MFSKHSLIITGLFQASRDEDSLRGRPRVVDGGRIWTVHLMDEIEPLKFGQKWMAGQMTEVRP
jgi:hypothetical protein